MVIEMTNSPKRVTRSMSEILNRIIARGDHEFYQLHSTYTPTPAIANYATMTHADFVKITNGSKEVFLEKDDSNNTLLHYAAKFGNLDLVQHALREMSFVESVNNHRNTPLDIAVKEDHIDIVKALLEAGANPVADRDNNIMESAKSEEVKELLLAHGCIEPVNFIEEFFQKIELLPALIEQSNKSHQPQDKCMDNPTIPHNVHYVWLTSPDNPREAPTDHLKYVTDSMAAFRNGTQYNDWSYQFHTNAPHALPNTTSFFESLGFQILDLTQEYTHFTTGSFLDIFIKTKKFGLAADLARYEIVNHDGGIYLDLNFNLTRSLDHEVCAYSYVNFDHSSNNEHGAMDNLPTPENYFFISRPNHPVLTQTISDVYDPFYGPKADTYWKNLNATDRGLTDGLFGKFSMNNVQYLTTNGEPGIIYSFPDGRFNSSYVSTTCYAPGMVDDIPEAYKSRLQELQETLRQTPNKLVCTNPDFAAPIGYDGINGNSWTGRDTSNMEFTDINYTTINESLAGEVNESTPQE